MPLKMRQEADHGTCRRMTLEDFLKFEHLTGMKSIISCRQSLDSTEESFSVIRSNFMCKIVHLALYYLISYYLASY